MNTLAIDVGTSGMKGIIYNEEGTALRQTLVTYAPTYSGEMVEQDPAIFKNAIIKVMGWADSVDAIALTAQRSSCICVGADGEPLGPAISWQDRRTVKLCDRIALEAGEIIQYKSGAHINPVFLAPKLTWVRENQPELYNKIWKFMTIADYLEFLLTGEAVTDDTYGSRTHLMNIETRKWDDELLDIFRVEKEKLCDILPVGSVTGRLRTKTAQEAGINSGIPVYTCGGDQQCALVGQRAVEKRNISVTLGTGMFIGTQIDRLPQVRSNEVIYNTSSIPGKYIVEYGTPTCAAAVNWFLKEIYGGLPIEKIDEELAKTAKGAGGVRALPFFQGRFTPDYDSSARASFSGLSLGTSREDLLRALIEGIAEEVRLGIGIVEAAGEEKEAMGQKAAGEEKEATGQKAAGEETAGEGIIVGGGLSRSRAVCRIIEETVGREITINDEKDATAFGAFLVSRGEMENL